MTAPLVNRDPGDEDEPPQDRVYTSGPAAGIPWLLCDDEDHDLLCDYADGEADDR